MTSNKGIFWLASYPKSGNTWFRIVLTNLLKSSGTPLDLNQINTGAIASARAWVDKALGFDSAELDHDELDNLRPAVYKWHAEHSQEIGYHKIHDAYTYLPDQKPLVPPDACLGAIYFIRNPLDVAISFANHSCCSIDQAIEQMGQLKYAFCKGKHKQHNQLRQWLLSWSLHVKSWTRVADINIHVIRYEDMKLNPLPTFTKAFQFLKLDVTQQAVEQAIDQSSIEKLQDYEEQFGFNEKPARVGRFFRKGVVGDWQTTLSKEQIKKIINDHGDIMQKYGYLTET